MLVNREQAKQIIDEMAVHFAEQFQCHTLIEQRTHYGIWDEVNLGGFGSVKDDGKKVIPISWSKGAMSRVLEEKYGISAVSEYRWVSADDEDIYIEVRPRFDNFCIAIHVGKHMGKIEIGHTYPCDEEDIHYLRGEDGRLLEPDETNYRFHEMLAFHDRGIKFCEMLLEEWNRRVCND